MDAWNILISKSSLQSGDAWEHLNAQIGGSGEYVVLTDGVEAMVEQSCFAVEIEGAEQVVAVDIAPLEVGVEEYEIEIEVCDGSE